MKDIIDKYDVKVINEFLNNIVKYENIEECEVDVTQSYIDILQQKKMIENYSKMKRRIYREKQKRQWITMCEVASVTHQTRARLENRYKDTIELLQSYLDESIIELMVNFNNDCKEYLILT